MYLDFLEFGEKGAPIVFLHGWQQDKTSLAPLVPFLYKTNKLFLLDLPGFGKSGFPNSVFSSWDYAQEIINWLKEQKINKPILVGHSFGGKVAAIIAAEKPDEVSKLILIGTAGIPGIKRWSSFKKILPGFIKKLLSPLLIPLLASEDYKNAGKLLPIFKTVAQEDLREVFEKITLMTLIIWGKDDKELPMEQADMIHKLIKNSRLEYVEGDHFPFQKNPEGVANLIHTFVSK